MKRLISVVLTITMVISLFTVVPVQAASYDENSYTLTGVQVNDIVGIAKTQVGYKEGNNSSQLDGYVSGSGNYTKYAKELKAAGYGASNPNAWCAYFVSWCAMKAGCLNSAISFFTGVKSCVAKSKPYKSNGLGTYHAIKNYTFKKGSVFRKDYTPTNIESYKPKKGDIMIFKTHVGLVVSDYNSSTDSFSIIEGNWGGKVNNRTVKMSNSELVGFVSPDYTTTTITPTHTHSYSYSNDSTHPHSEYKYCSCGNKEYTGAKKLIASCQKCYPIGNVKLTRSFEKADGIATFYRNTVSNATSYTLKLYQDGSLYDQYTMSSYEKIITGLPSGNYTATLYAKNSNTGEERSDSCESFKIAETYSVSYNANGGSNAPSSHEKLQDDSNFTLKTQAPTKAHYIFKGWARSKNATVAEYQPGDTYSRNAKVTLYAVWEPEIYTIKFDANGGKGEIEDTTITYGDAIRIPNDTVKDGYYLKGWSTSKTATTATYKIGMDYKFDANTTLYAVWGTSTWTGGVSTSLSGSGTEADPYLIQSEADLGYLANKVNTQDATPIYEYYKLTNNIDLAYNEWVPIGIGDTAYQYFYGTFDGCGYTISGLYITSDEYSYYGLFGEAKNSSLKNFRITGDFEDINIANKNVRMGAVVGYISSSHITDVNISYFDVSNITISNSNTGNSKSIYVGGVAGELYFGSIDNCTSNNSVTSIENESVIAYIGGICGTAKGGISNCSVVNDGVLFGRLKTTRSIWLGGIAGSASTITNCFVKASRLTHKQSVDGAVFAGGICGSATTVEKCSVQFVDKDTIAFNEKSIPYSAYITTTDENGFGIGRLGGISSSGGTIKNCKYDGASLIMICNSANSFNHSAVGGISGGSLSVDTVKQSVSNVDGILYCSGPGNFLFAGGIVGAGTGPDVVNNSLIITDSVTANNTEGTKTTSSGDYIIGGFGGDIGGFSGYDHDPGDAIYTNDDLKVNATTIETLVGTSKSVEKIKTKVFQRNLLGLGEYISISELENSEDAVWVLRDNDLPELYYNCLNEISISDDIENGSVTIDKTQAVDGEVVTVTATPNDGYVLNKVYVDGIEQDGTTFIVDGNDELYVTFAEEIAEYNVTISANDNATGSLVNMDSAEPMLMSVRLMSSETDSTITAKDGEEILVNANADTDYTVDAIYVNGEEVAGNSFILTEDSVVTMDVTNISTDIVATTNDTEDVGSYFAVVSGSVSGEDENAVKYIRYWSADNVETVYVTEVESGSGDYITELMDLEPETTYYYQLTEFGEIKSFTTCSEEIDEHIGDEDGGYDESENQSLTSSTYIKTQTGYEFSIECSQSLSSECLAVGVYTSDYRLISMNIVDCDGNDSYTTKVPLDNKIKYAKIFVWTSKTNLEPLGTYEIIEITN